MITTKALDLSRLLAAVSDSGHGALVTFSGTVRAQEKNRTIKAIDYQAYDTMAAKLFITIERQARERWGARVKIAHRKGKVPVGHASVIIAAGAPHRKEAFLACRFAIEKIKQDAPIWKLRFT
ncbi:MAG: molybdenum cofactor biosynthesis protein MoaE [Elusimicrobiota bacterium]